MYVMLIVPRYVTDTEATEHYLNALQSCTSLEKLTIEFYLSPNNFQLNDAAWIVAAHSFRCSPQNSVCRFNIKFSAGYDAELSSVAFENLHWKHMNDVWPQWSERPTLTSATNNGFDDTQKTITTFEWLSLLPWLMCTERDHHLDDVSRKAQCTRMPYLYVMPLIVCLLSPPCSLYAQYASRFTFQQLYGIGLPG
ncbi:hypothetical protein BC835DRAFT_662013 [Cytidiella melzeri]|nr:hypothetical protein BC835DRAFT_662013 [Cytidiella melzeri]